MPVPNSTTCCWENGRISFTIQPDPAYEYFQRTVDTATEGGLVELFGQVGEQSLKRLDGSLLWAAHNDEMIYTLSGSVDGNTVEATQLAEMAQIIIDNR